MKNTFKKIITMIMVLSIVCTTGMSAFATEAATDSVLSNRASYSTLHKINGTYSSGGSASFNTTTTKTCYEIRVSGTTYSSGTKYVDVVVQLGSVVVASAYNVPLNGSQTKMTLWVPYTTKIPANTYTVYVTSHDTKEYDCSTYFYY